MRKTSILSAGIALLFASFSAVAQNPPGAEEWNNQFISGVNKEKAVEVVIPFNNE